MTNHYHLVVETLREQLSAGMHRLNGVYAEQFNGRYRRTGHLWGFDIESPGKIRPQPPHDNGGRHLEGPAGFTSFDSLAVEENGNICSACP